jgi:hypothetical protein
VLTLETGVARSAVEEVLEYMPQIAELLLKGYARHVGKPRVIFVALQFGEALRGVRVGEQLAFSAGIPAVVPLRVKVERPVPVVARVTEDLGQRCFLIGGRIETNPVRRVVVYGVYLEDDTRVKFCALACKLAYLQREGPRITR